MNPESEMVDETVEAEAIRLWKAEQDKHPWFVDWDRLLTFMKREYRERARAALTGEVKP